MQTYLLICMDGNYSLKTSTTNYIRHASGFNSHRPLFFFLLRGRVLLPRRQ